MLRAPPQEGAAQEGINAHSTRKSNQTKGEQQGGRGGGEVCGQGTGCKENARVRAWTLETGRQRGCCKRPREQRGPSKAHHDGGTSLLAGGPQEDRSSPLLHSPGSRGSDQLTSIFLFFISFRSSFSSCPAARNPEHRTAGGREAAAHTWWLGGGRGGRGEAAGCVGPRAAAGRPVGMQARTDSPIEACT